MSSYRGQLTISIIVVSFTCILMGLGKISPSEGLPVLAGIYGSWMPTPSMTKTDKTDKTGKMQ